ncbi:MAG: hypothetical protein A3C43_11825 [Candidatus Schekmanbacteria bacterium RIFCSPHIGHO2_02_FULL_38_11]|uniref:ATP synthase subunit I n=1 Tax=Candidatus Schekmanbacteria bacterium RIFCSPLOWO2_12_FULL_38_15 TaxID=1817883 RepID=A0A1F7SGC5_9BACT|nr:MAG: hypothetical protein A2043_10765 [Candidatus Schekmanbacteria bacterium GWA2_38_9]OGL49362.1 MAG: hypothetical protein A3H37_06760 [Candidatus Schekmanbacteria bacterium RIFCSPLOWO2_02_FULL_38_14]OGL50547.1 MAG: hypothetical protein A3C43_11825 [Candidatus Schekmanbacteria bacterium RIFCSPHIGHO2_02_FULL_38_11]OGL52840.1 MAG: hypothetical protein A3G31_00380 [Candidatus Schekmanbacteria bacterium RIFCSPLOWO2_12_FULL_38_15]
MFLSIYKINDKIIISVVVLIIILISVSLLIRNSELLIGTILGGVTGIINYILLCKTVGQLSDVSNKPKRKGNLFFFTFLRYIIMFSILAAGILISRNCLIFVLISMSLPQISMIIKPLLEKKERKI